jgi:radical SAM superfamily enzyme YgiQ (UPF0313 family)
MVGMPGETPETIEKSIAFVKEIDPTVVTFGICTPYPGTELFNQVLEKKPEAGDGSECDLGRLHTSSFFNDVFTDMSDEALSRGIRKAYRKFYLRPGYMFKWLKRLDSLAEFKRVVLAGTQVFDFIFRGDEAPRPTGED